MNGAKQRKANSPDCSSVEHACEAGLFQLLELLCESFGSAAAVLGLRITATEQQILSMTIEALLHQTVLIDEARAELDAQHFASRIVETVFVRERGRAVVKRLFDDRKQRIDAERVTHIEKNEMNQFLFVCSFETFK